MISTDTQQLVLKDSLNSSLLFTFLMGIYITVSAFTIYIYITRKKNRSIIVAGALVVLLVSSIANLALQWKMLNVCFITSDQTTSSIFVCTLNIQATGYNLAVGVITDLQSVVSDGLLVWRCYHLAGKSIRTISLIVFFLGLEIVTGIASITITAMDELRVVNQTTRHVTDIINILFFVTTALTSILSTIFICRRIKSSLDKTQHSHTQRYRRIIQSAIESSVIYAIAAVFNVGCYICSTIIPFTLGSESILFYGVGEYGTACSFALMILAPTLMIAHISLSPSPGSTVVEHSLPMSVIQFQHQTTIANSMHPTTPSVSAGASKDSYGLEKDVLPSFPSPDAPFSV